MKVYIKAISSKEINGGTDILTDVRVAIQDTKTLTNVIVNLQKISDIYEIKRGTR
jgi:(p)ppGpp synthase/HD superfamily hydrolase